MKGFFLFVLCWFMFTATLAQQRDSLIQLLRGNRLSDTSRVLTLVRLSFQLSDSKPDSAFKLSSQADSLARAIRYNKGLGRASRGIGRFYFVQGDFKEAASAFQQAIVFCRLANDKRGEANAQVDL